MAGKLLVSLRDGILLRNSQITEDYPWLLKLLRRYTRISEEMAESLPISQQNFICNMISHLVKEAELEWKPRKVKFVEDKGPDRSKWLNCSLCRQPNRVICYIINQHNGEMLNVGRECVGAFDISDEHRELLKDPTRIRQLTKMNEQFPAIHDIVQGWEREVDQYPVLIPKMISKDYLDAGERIRQLYDGYLCEAYDDSIFTEVGLILKHKETQQAAMEKWVAENGPRKYIPRQTLITWLRNNGGHDVIEMLREDGEITWRTIHRIGEPGFLQSLVGDLNKGLVNFGFTVDKVDTSFGGFAGYAFTVNNIQLCCKYTHFLLRVGGVLFNEELHNDPYDVIKKSVPYTRTSVYRILNAIDDMLKSTTLSIYEQDLEYNEILFANKMSGNYISVGLRDFTDRFKGIALGLPGESIDDAIRYIRDARNKHYTREGLSERDQIRKHNRF